MSEVENIATFPSHSDTDDNRPEKEPDVNGVGGARIKSYIERIERLEEEKTALADDIKDVYGEAKAVGLDAKTLRKIVRLRKMDTEKRREEDELLDLYMSAIGMA